jgi:23S rRNA pseudouridine955/2504/2580 synthase
MRARGLDRLFLHAAHFEFAIGENSHSFSAPMPPELASTIDALQKK